MKFMQYWKEKFRWHYKNRLKKLKLGLKYFSPRPIYITSKQGNPVAYSTRQTFDRSVRPQKGKSYNQISYQLQHGRCNLIQGGNYYGNGSTA